MAFFRRKFKSDKVVQKRRKKRKIIFLSFFVLFVLFVLGLSFLSKLDRININQIEVTGNSVTSESRIIEIVDKNLAGSYLALFSKKNALLYPGNAIEEELMEKIKRLYGVETDVENFQKLTITVKERSPEVMWCQRLDTGQDTFEDHEVSGENQSCFFADDTGFIYSEAPIFSGNVFPRVYGGVKGKPIGKRYLTPPEFQGLISFLNLLEEDGLETEFVLIDKNDDFKLILVEGTEILFNRSQDFNTLLQNLRSIFADKTFKEDTSEKEVGIDYIDLRFGRKVFYKLE